MNRIILVLLLLAGTSAIQAQGVKLGLTASPQISWMNSDAAKVEGNGSVLGFNFGLNTDFFFTENYAFSTGFFINNAGGKLMYSDSSSFSTGDGLKESKLPAEVKYTVQYIEIPLAIKMHTNTIGYFQYFAQFGLSNQIRVNSIADIDRLALKGVSFKNEVNLFNIGYQIGIGANYFFTKSSAFTAGIIYTNGFTDITDNSQVNDKSVMKSFSLKVGMIF